MEPGKAPLQALSVRGQTVSTSNADMTRAHTYLCWLWVPGHQHQNLLLQVAAESVTIFFTILKQKRNVVGSGHHLVQPVLSGRPLPTVSCHPYFQWVNVSCWHDLCQVYFRKEMQKTSSWPVLTTDKEQRKPAAPAVLPQQAHYTWAAPDLMGRSCFTASENCQWPFITISAGLWSRRAGL